MKKLIIGVDVGGTNIKLGLLNSSGKIISRSRLITVTFSRDQHRLIKALCDAIQALMAKNHVQRKDILGIGMGLPGPINSAEGVVKYLPNIPGWNDVPLGRIIQSKLKIPTFIDNDVNLITLGEWKFGVGRGYRNLVCMTLGTGVGGGLILDGKLYRGEGFVAGEIGHMLHSALKQKSTFGFYGYFEHFVGNRQLIANGQKIFGARDIRIQDIFAKAQQGNPRAIRFWEEIGEHIGNVLVSIINLLNPRLIIIGGGVANNFKFFHPAIKKIIQQRAMKVHGQMVKVVRSRLGDSAGLIGAYVLVKQELGLK
jgi:glucokinase